MSNYESRKNYNDDNCNPHQVLYKSYIQDGEIARAGLQSLLTKMEILQHELQEMTVDAAKDNRDTVCHKMHKLVDMCEEISSTIPTSSFILTPMSQTPEVEISSVPAVVDIPPISKVHPFRSSDVTQSNPKSNSNLSLSNHSSFHRIDHKPKDANDNDCIPIVSFPNGTSSFACTKSFNITQSIVGNLQTCRTTANHDGTSKQCLVSGGPGIQLWDLDTTLLDDTSKQTQIHTPTDYDNDHHEDNYQLLSKDLNEGYALATYMLQDSTSANHTHKRKVYLAAGCRNGNIHLWNMGYGCSNYADFNDNGDANGQPIRPRRMATLWGHSNHVSALACTVITTIIPQQQQYHDDNDNNNQNNECVILVSGSYDHTIKVWDLCTNKLITTLHGHASEVYALDIFHQTITPNANHDPTTVTAFNTNKHINHTITFIASVSNDRTIKIWNLNTQSLVTTLTQSTTWILSLASIPQKQKKHPQSPYETKFILAAGCDDGTIQLWDMTDYSHIANLKGHSNYIRALSVIRWNHNNNVNSQNKNEFPICLVSGSDDRTIQVWNLDHIKEIAKEKPEQHEKKEKDDTDGDYKKRILMTLTDHTGPIRAIRAFQHDGKAYLASGDSGGTIKIWSTESRCT